MNKHKGNIVISRIALLDLLRPLLPKDTELTGNYAIDYDSDVILVRATNPNFPEVKEGECIPRVNLLLKMEGDKLISVGYELYNIIKNA